MIQASEMDKRGRRALCHSLGRPLLLCVALIGQWRYSLNTEKLTATMQIAERVHSLAQEHNDAALMIGACRVLAVTLYFLGDFESARRYAKRGLQIWRSVGVQSPSEEIIPPAIACLCSLTLCEWHLGEVASSRAAIAEAISLAKELNNMHAVAEALSWAAGFGHAERNPAEVDRLTSDLIELSTRHNFVYWLAQAAVLRGSARSASGKTVEGISWIEEGIRDYRATGSMIRLPYFLALKAEALYLAHRCFRSA